MKKKTASKPKKSVKKHNATKLKEWSKKNGVRIIHGYDVIKRKNS